VSPPKRPPVSTIALFLENASYIAEGSLQTETIKLVLSEFKGLLGYIDQLEMEAKGINKRPNGFYPMLNWLAQQSREAVKNRRETPDKAEEFKGRTNAFKEAHSHLIDVMVLLNHVDENS